MATTPHRDTGFTSAAGHSFAPSTYVDRPEARITKQSPPPSFFQRNGLTIAFLILMVLSIIGHVLTGWRVENTERQEHGNSPQPIGEYVSGGQFLSTLFENWESEFLQMALFVVLTVKLRQKGSSESRPMDPSEEPKKTYPKSLQPWPVKRGGIWRKAYEHSLSAALFLLFAGSFVAHWVNSWRQERDKNLLHGDAVVPLWDYLASAQLWFESFQNWQSEFLAVVALAVLSIYLREKDSSQSKDVDAPHSHTGE